MKFPHDVLEVAMLDFLYFSDMHSVLICFGV